MTVTWRSVKVWVNAFIPKNVSGYTKTVPAGPYKDSTMIPGPFTWSDCFLTDQRGFSNHIHAKSRMHCEARLELRDSTAKLTQWHNCDWTTECDCETGEQECRKKGDTSDMEYTLSRAGSILILSLQANAWNPCSPSSSVGGEIDMSATIKIDPSAKTLSCTARVDSFPAFEAYATINDGEGVQIFRRSPPPGNTVMDLPGTATTTIKTVTLIDPGSGAFVNKGAKYNPPSVPGQRQDSRRARPR
jgi:hypothetical protein